MSTEVRLDAHNETPRYHLPRSVREHVDYIMPGIALREVTNVGKKRSAESAGGLSKRATFPNPISPILHPIAVPLEVLLNDLLPLCAVAVTPECIKRE